MKRLYFLSMISLFLLSACRKEGLSKDTGNLEITFHYGNNSFQNYVIYEKDQYYRWLENNTATPYRAGGAGSEKIIEKALPKGDYGIVIWIDNTWRSHKLQYVAANKVTKIQMP